MASFALTFVKTDGLFGHLLLYRTEEGWLADNVQGIHPTLYKLLSNMSHFVNMIDSPGLVPDESKSNSQRSFKTFLIEKHEFLGILFYRVRSSSAALFFILLISLKVNESLMC